MTKTKRFKIVGIDLDKAEGQTDASFVKFVVGARERAMRVGRIIQARYTKRGYHLKIYLPRQVGFWRTIEIRYFVGDDPRRMFYDIARHHSGGRMLDTLFDVKKEGVPIDGV